MKNKKLSIVMTRSLFFPQNLLEYVPACPSFEQSCNLCGSTEHSECLFSGENTKI